MRKIEADFIVKRRGDTDAEKYKKLLNSDTYYARNALIDLEYEAYFARRKRIDGKRLPCTMYTRKYIY